MNNPEPSPFKVGDRVRYAPSSRGLAIEVMSSPERKLVPGKTYRVESIQDAAYVTVEGYYHPGNGLYWTEFAKVEDLKST